MNQMSFLKIIKIKLYRRQYYYELQFMGYLTMIFEYYLCLKEF